MLNKLSSPNVLRLVDKRQIVTHPRDRKETSEWSPYGGEVILPWGNIANLGFSDNRVVLEFSETELAVLSIVLCFPVDGF